MFTPAQLRLPPVKTKTILLGGGLDLESPMFSVGEGFALEADNFEPNLMGGYRKMLGYERVDGKPAPSDAVYYVIKVANANYFNLGDKITGSSSGATANIVAIDTDKQLIGVTNLVGKFDVGDAVGVTTVIIPESSNDYPDQQIDAQWQLLAQNYYRNLIAPVPGSGRISGVWYWNSNYYAFRSDGAVVKMYQSSTSGWVEIAFYSLLKFNSGQFLEGGVIPGDVIEGSNATATVKKAIKVGGSYGSDAHGYLVIDITSGGFVDGEAVSKSGATIFTADGADEAISFTLGENNFRFENYNFGGNPSTYYMYGCDGVNRGFEFDGDTLTPILTYNTVDAPTHLSIHQNHLFYSFDGGSLQSSVPTDPLVFNGTFGSVEIGLGDDIRGLKSITGNVLLISTDQGVSGLYGSDASDFQVQKISVDSGDVANTIAVIGSPIITTHRGITRIDASQVYGSFESSTVSRRIYPLLYSWLQIKKVVGVSIVRAKNQYRIYFDDGSGIVMTSDQLYAQQQLPEFTTFTRPSKPTCMCSVSLGSSEEVVLFGGDDGYIYQEEKGYSHDGEQMQYAIRLPYHHLGSPAVRKSFKHLDVEVDAEKTADLRLSYEFSDGSADTLASPLEHYNVLGAGRAYWGEGIYSEFNWNGGVIARKNISLSGTGHNVSLLFYGESATAAPFLINSVTYQYVPRRLNRG